MLPITVQEMSFSSPDQRTFYLRHRAKEIGMKCMAELACLLFICRRFLLAQQDAERVEAVFTYAETCVQEHYKQAGKNHINIEQHRQRQAGIQSQLFR